MMKTVSMDNKNKMAVLRSMLNYIKSNDPQFRSFIEQQTSNNHQTINKEIIRRLRIQNKKLLEQVALLKGQVKQIKSEKNKVLNRLDLLIKLSNLLSGALGSCNICWGGDPGCINCSGKGSPGRRNINRRLFNIHVLPAVKKVYGLSGKIKCIKLK